jgi:uncharacterized protein YndB with AHSA1/START domain
MFLKIVIVLVVLIAVVLAFAATKPNAFRIQRSITIQASPATVFALIDDFHDWSRWAPQDREDATMRRSFSGPASGTGAVSAWQGTRGAGKGSMMITDSVPASRVTVQTDFIKPFEAHNVNKFVLQPAGGQTSVTWSMEGSNLYVMKVMSVFINMDRMMGKHFEGGLANLKAEAEK